MNHALPFFLPKSITRRRLDKAITGVSDGYGTLEYVLVRSSLLLHLHRKTLFPCTEEMSVLCAINDVENAVQPLSRAARASSSLLCSTCPKKSILPR